MTTVIEDGGRTNMYAKEPQMQVMEVSVTHNEIAEKLNGRLAMLGVIAALGAYALTGDIIPGIFWCSCISQAASTEAPAWCLIFTPGKEQPFAPEWAL